MNATYAAVVGQEPRDTREVPVPAGVGVTRQVRKRHMLGKGRVVPNNDEMLDWLDHSTPGWYAALKGVGNGRSHRVFIFTTSAHAALFKLFWT